jgi:hypothetical protein
MHCCLSPSCCRVLLEKSVLTQRVKKLSAFIESESSLVARERPPIHAIAMPLTSPVEGKLVHVLNELSTTPRRCMGSGGVASLFLTSAIDGGEWWTSRPSHFTPGVRDPGIRCVGGWMDLKAGLDAIEKRRICCPCRNRTPAPKPV